MPDPRSDDETISFASRLEVLGRVWAIREELLCGLESLHGHSLSADLVEQIETASKAAGTIVPASGVAVIGVKGIITPRPSLLSLIFGGGDGSLLSLTRNLRSAAANPEVGSIVLDVDSPGGSAAGVPEAAAIVRKVGEQKPIVAVANTMIGSGAYWLASQAHEIVASPSSELGSIGAYRIHRDVSEGLAQAGIKPTIIKAGTYKIDANPYEPLSADAAAAVQQAVDDCFTLFVNDVAKGRGADPQEVRDGYGEGRMLTAKRAVSAGLADRVATLDATVARLASGRARIKRTDDRSTLEWPEGPEVDETSSEGVDYTLEERDRMLATLAGLGA